MTLPRGVIPPHELERLIRECYEKNPCETRRKHLDGLGQWYIKHLPPDPPLRGASLRALWRALSMIPDEIERDGRGGDVTTIEQGGKEPIYRPTPALAKAVARDDTRRAREAAKPWKMRRRLRFWES